MLVLQLFVVAEVPPCAKGQNTSRSPTALCCGCLAQGGVGVGS